LKCLGGEVRVIPDALTIVSVRMSRNHETLCLFQKYYFPAEEWSAP